MQNEYGVITSKAFIRRGIKGEQHCETCAQLNLGYCAYTVFFRADGTVESKVFA